MTLGEMPGDSQLALAPLEENVDHLRGSPARACRGRRRRGRRATALGTPTLFIDGVVHRGDYDPPTLMTALAP
jgi:hypothetical protein